MQAPQGIRYGSPFGSPLLDYVWPDSAGLNQQLRDAVLLHERTSPGAALTNVGGWHSETGTLEFCGQAGKELVRRIMAMTEAATTRLFAEYDAPVEPLDWTLSAWANVNRRGDFNKMHTHPGATWSGVYYVDSGDTDPAAEGTAIHLTDPCPTRSSSFFPALTATNIVFSPTPALMILFPSYLPHAVLPHTGDRPRISIAFNVRKDPFP
jgi:uncharacterized protein (TIGR02466 family)